MTNAAPINDPEQSEGGARASGDVASQHEAGSDDFRPTLASRLGEAVRRPAVRVAGAGLGLALLVSALIVVLTAPEPRAALALAIRGDPILLGLLPLLILGNIVATAMVFRPLMARFGTVGRLEMVELMAASTLLNFVPLRPGLLGRVGWHAVMNSIPAQRSVQAIGESILLGAASIVCVVLAVLATPELTLPIRSSLVLAAAFAPIVATLTVPSLRPYAGAMTARAFDLVIWGLRYLVAFHLVGSPIDLPAALAIAAAASTASLVPLAGNGLGLREWTTGLLAPYVADVTLDAGLAADLLNRAAELVTILPAGLAAIGALLARARRARAQRSRRTESRA